MAQFQKGQGGRPKGAKNKSTEQIRKSFSKLLSNNLEQLETDLQSLEPKERVKVLIDLAKFILPTLKSQELKTESEIISKQLDAQEVKLINAELEKYY